MELAMAKPMTLILCVAAFATGLDAKETANREAWTWPFEKPVRRVPPSVVASDWVRNPVGEPTVDPENKLLWRFRRRRLEAEAIRDSILLVSERLSLLRYGPGVFPPLPEGLDDLGKPVRPYSVRDDSRHGNR